MNQEHIEIVSYQDEHADAFSRLNREWLDKFELYEEADGKHLYTPREYILDRGGEIFIAQGGKEVAGTCAIVPFADGVFEVAKLTVSRKCRGNGLGRELLEFALERARQRNAKRVVLLSSRKLVTALKLYESIGFMHRPIPNNQPYETADVYMELELEFDPSRRVEPQMSLSGV